MYQRLRRRLKEQRGFTLIELVVVVAILGILAVILTPRVIGAMDNARENSGKSIGKQIQVAMERYATDHSAYPNLDNDPATTGSALTTAQVGTFIADLAPYVPIDDNHIIGVTYDIIATTDPHQPNYNIVIRYDTGAPVATITIAPDSVTTTAQP